MESDAISDGALPVAGRDESPAATAATADTDTRGASDIQDVSDTQGVLATENRPATPTGPASPGTPATPSTSATSVINSSVYSTPEVSLRSLCNACFHSRNINLCKLNAKFCLQ